MINTVQEYFTRKIRSTSISRLISFENHDGSGEEKFEKKFYKVSINDILNDMESDYEDLIKRINVQVIRKIDDLYGYEISKNHVRYLNYCLERLNDVFDIIDYECTKLFEIDQKDQEIIEILTKNEKREMVEDEEIKEILEEIHKDMKEKVRLKIEIEFEKKLINFKKENSKEIEKHLNFLSTESKKKIAFEEMNLNKKIQNFNIKCKEFLKELD